MRWMLYVLTAECFIEEPQPLFVSGGAPSGKVSKENLLLVTVKVAVATMYSIQGACSILCSFEDECVHMYKFSLLPELSVKDKRTTTECFNSGLQSNWNIRQCDKLWNHYVEYRCDVARVK